MNEKKNKRIGIVTFTVDGVGYRFKEPLMLNDEYKDGKLYLSYEELGLSAVGKSWSDTSNLIREQLEMIWTDYALAPDSKLAPSGLELKKKLRGMVK